MTNNYNKPRYRKPSDDRRKSRECDYASRESRNQTNKQSRHKTRTSSADNFLQDRSFQNQSFQNQNQKISKNRATIAGKTETKYGTFIRSLSYFHAQSFIFLSEINFRKLTSIFNKHCVHEKLMRERLYGFGQINAVDC